jgi:hypothetical protein
VLENIAVWLSVVSPIAIIIRLVLSYWLKIATLKSMQAATELGVAITGGTESVKDGLDAMTKNAKLPRISEDLRLTLRPDTGKKIERGRESSG